MTTSFLVLDIETVLDPELPIVATDAERLPSPPHHKDKVVVIGALLFDGNYEVKRINVIRKCATTACATWPKRPAYFCACSWSEAKLIVSTT